jgi:hypothetical protein
MAISKINSRSIQDGTVVGADITPGTVTNAKISPSAAIANAKLANSSITISGSSVSLGGSVTVNTAIDWQAVTVADGSTTVNCVAGKGYFLDTNAGVIEAFLPTSPTRGDRVVLADYSGTFATNQAIVNTGGELLDSTAGNDFKLTTNNTIAEFIYVDSAKGWLVYLNQAAGTTPSSALTDGNIYDSDAAFISATGGTVTTSGDYKIHTFTGDGCFVVSQGPVNTPGVDYLVVAGGGGGSKGRAGGAGAGGFRVSNSLGLPAPTMSPLANPTGLTVTATTYPITVGGGGAGKSGPPNGVGVNGSNSVFSTITSTGGGGGGYDGTTGGSGGSGGAGGESSVGSAVGSGNTPPTSPPQGNPGGASEYSPPAGGPHPESPRAGAQGGQSDSSPGDNGGVGGVGSYVSPSFAVGCAGTTGPVCGVRYFAGGGAGNGCAASNPGTPVPAPLGGGGAGTTGPCSGVAGTANTGGGGAAWGDIYNPGSGGAGGKGIVIIRYKFQ